MKKSVRVGLVQMYCSPDPKKNFERAEKGIMKLAKKGACIVCLPELFRTPYFCQTEDKKNFRLAESIPGPTTDFLSMLAKKSGATLITSIFEKAPTDTFYNTAVIISPNRSRPGIYRKMHIPDDLKNFYGERYYFSPGNLGVRVSSTSEGNICSLICFDQWFPEGARLAASKGAQILFYPTAIGWEQKPGMKHQKAEHEAWQIIQRSHAIANNIFVVAVNRVGLDQKLHFWGTSFVSDPFGQMIVKAPVDRETDLIADCDLSLIDAMRHDWPFLTARRIPLKHHV